MAKGGCWEKKLCFFHEKTVKNGENRRKLKILKNAQKHPEALPYWRGIPNFIALRKIVFELWGIKVSGEGEEEPCRRSKIGDFVQAIKSEPRRISTCGLRHLVPWDEIFPLKHSNHVKIAVRWPLEAAKMGNYCAGNIARRSAVLKLGGGARPLSRSLDTQIC